MYDPRVENDENNTRRNTKSNNNIKKKVQTVPRKGNLIQPSRPKSSNNKRNGRRMKRPQSGKPRARVRFSMDLDSDLKGKKRRPRSAGQQRRARAGAEKPSPYANNSILKQKHPDLLRYAKYSEKSTVPKPVRSSSSMINKKGLNHKVSNIQNNTNDAVPNSPRMTDRNGMSLKNATEAYCRELEKRVSRQITILAHNRKEVKTTKQKLKEVKDKNRKLMRRSAATIADLKKRLQIAEKRPSPHLVRMRKERDTVLIELKRLTLLNDQLKNEKEKMEQDFEIEREYFREEIEALRQNQTNSKLKSSTVDINNKKENGISDAIKLNSYRNSTSSGAGGNINVSSPNSWKAFHKI